MWRPTALDPVNDTLSIPGWWSRCSPVSRLAATMLITPGGRSDSSTASARRYASRGVSGAGLRTIGHPAAIAGPSFNAAMNSGTFHGMIPAATPTGARRTSTGEPSAPSRRSSHG